MLRQIAWFVGAVFATMACSGTQSQPPRTQATQTTQLTSAEITSAEIVAAPQMSSPATGRPPGSADNPPPMSVETQLARQMEEDKKYPTPSVETARQWADRYPFPARLLSDWSNDYPQMAKLMVRWEDQQPDHARVLVKWAVAHPYDGLSEFMIDRRGWEDLRTMRDAEPLAIDDFLAWCRAAPRAAEELVMHSEGLRPILLGAQHTQSVSSGASQR